MFYPQTMGLLASHKVDARWPATKSVASWLFGFPMVSLCPRLQQDCGVPPFTSDQYPCRKRESWSIHQWPPSKKEWTLDPQKNRGLFRILGTKSEGPLNHGALGGSQVGSPALWSARNPSYRSRRAQPSRWAARVCVLLGVQELSSVVHQLLSNTGEKVGCWWKKSGKKIPHRAEE